jgi:uncharacterized protein
MTTRSRAHDPRRLDVERFAREGAQLEGSWPLAGMHRIVESCHPDAPPKAQDTVAWTARGEHRRVGGGQQTWLRLGLRTNLRLTCQRCLGPVETPLDVQRGLRFVEGEDNAAALDAEVEDDVLARSHALDLHALAEDELLLALPIVPRHEACPVPLLASRPEVADVAAPAAAHPFAALAGLKKARH